MIFSDICIEFLKSLLVAATQMIVHHLVKFENPSKQPTFNKRIVYGMTFKATPSVIYPVGVAKSFEDF